MLNEKANTGVCVRVDVKEAAKEIGCHPEYLRRKMKEKKWDIGRVEPPKKKGGKYTYLIFRPKLDKFLGMEGESREDRVGT